MQRQWCILPFDLDGHWPGGMPLSLFATMDSVMARRPLPVRCGKSRRVVGTGASGRFESCPIWDSASKDNRLKPCYAAPVLARPSNYLHLREHRAPGLPTAGGFLRPTISELI